MKFGVYLKEHTRPGWEEHYLEYDKLKEIVKALTKTELGLPQMDVKDYTTSLTVQGQAPTFSGKLGTKDVSQEDFFKAIDRNVQKIGNFTALQVKQSQKLLGNLESDVDVALQNNMPDLQLQSLEIRAKEIGDTFLDLEKYININYTGFYKILKKHDKNLPSTPARQFYMARLHQTPWIQGDYSAVFVTLSRIYSKLRDDVVPEAQDLTLKDFVRSTRKYWVKTQHVSQVKHMILQHLPVFQVRQDLLSGDSQMTNSAYFDNSQLELYHGRLEKRPQAIALRIRWYGLGDPELAFIERKTHKESWKGEISVKERFTLPPDMVIPFLKGEYSVDEAAEALRSKGKTEAEISKFKQLFQEVQKVVDVKQLQPLMRTQYMRVAFQIPFDATVRVSLDTNLCMIKENPERGDTCLESGRWFRDPSLPVPRTEITKFPHAVLEVKLSLKENEDAPLWVTQLIDSGLLHEVHKFSKFIHGCAVLLPDRVQAVPYWIDDESIRDSILSSSHATNAESTYSSLSKRRMKIDDEEEPSRSAGSPYAGRGESELTHPLLGDYAMTDLIEDSNGGRYSNNGKSRNILNFFFQKQPPYLRRKVPMRIEPKTNFANERTFLRWIHMSIVLGGVSSAMLGGASPDDQDAHVIGLLAIPLAISITMYGIWIYYWRALQIRKKEARYSVRFDDRIGPICLAVILICLYVTVFVYKVSKLMNY